MRFGSVQRSRQRPWGRDAVAKMEMALLGIIEEPSKLHQLKSKKLTPYTDPTVRDESVATGAFVYLHTPVLGPNMEEMRAKEMREMASVHGPLVLFFPQPLRDSSPQLKEKVCHVGSPFNAIAFPLNGKVPNILSKFTAEIDALREWYKAGMPAPVAAATPAKQAEGKPGSKRKAEDAAGPSKATKAKVDAQAG